MLDPFGAIVMANLAPRSCLSRLEIQTTSASRNAAPPSTSQSIPSSGNLALTAITPLTNAWRLPRFRLPPAPPTEATMRTPRARRALASATKDAWDCDAQPVSLGGLPCRNARFTTLTPAGVLRSRGEPEFDHIMW